MMDPLDRKVLEGYRAWNARVTNEHAQVRAAAKNFIASQIAANLRFNKKEVAGRLRELERKGLLR